MSRGKGIGAEGLSRRRFLKTAASLLIAGPAACGLADRERHDESTTSCPKPVYAQNRAWTNEHHSRPEIVIERFYDRSSALSCLNQSGDQFKRGLQYLRAIVSEAEQSKKSLRALGSGWSLSDAALDTETMLDTQPLRGCKRLATADFDAQAANPEHIVLVQCGTLVAELNTYLEANGMALPTSGASNGQTIGGALSIGTHGAALHFGAMQEFVVGFHLLCGAGNEYWVERKSDPCVSPGFCEKIGAKFVRDDNLFNAAVVNLGSFGLIHSVAVRADSKYVLKRHQKFYSWHDVKRCIDTLQLNSLHLPDPKEPDHLEISVNPYGLSSAKAVSVNAMWRQPYNDAEKNSYKLRAPSVDPSVVLFPVLATLAQEGSAKLIHDGVNLAFALGFPEVDDVATPGTMFGPLPNKGEISMLTSEIAVPCSQALATLRLMIDIASKLPFPGGMGLRYVKGSRATMAFTRFEITCAIDISALNCEKTQLYLRRIWSELEQNSFDFTMHWGKLNALRPDLVRRMYGTAVDDWRGARQYFLPTANARRLFTNQYLTNCGLAS